MAQTAAELFQQTNTTQILTSAAQVVAARMAQQSQRASVPFPEISSMASNSAVVNVAKTLQLLSEQDFRIGVVGQELINDLSFLSDESLDAQQLDIDHFESKLDKESVESFTNEAHQNCNHTEDIREIKQMISHLYFENITDYEEHTVNKNQKMANKHDDSVETQHRILTFINICAIVISVLKYSQDIYELAVWIKEMIQTLFFDK